MDVLPPAAQEAVLRHLASCAVCRALVEALDDPSTSILGPDDQERLRTRVGGELSGSPSSFLARSRSWWWPAMAAAALLIVAASALVRQFRAASTEDPSSVLQLQKPVVRHTADPDLVFRGATPGQAADLARALEPFEANDFAEAERRLADMVRRHPESAAAHLHLGVSLLFLRQSAAAVPALEQAERLAVGQPDLAGDAGWYLALAFRATGQNARTVQKLDAICRAGTPRSAAACAGARELSSGSSTPPR